jgi:hypothetical protein
MRDEFKLSKILSFITDYHAVQLIEMPRICFGSWVPSGYSPRSGFFCMCKLLHVSSAQGKDYVLLNRIESTFPTLLKP